MRSLAACASRRAPTACRPRWCIRRRKVRNWPTRVRRGSDGSAGGHGSRSRRLARRSRSGRRKHDGACAPSAASRDEASLAASVKAPLEVPTQKFRCSRLRFRDDAAPRGPTRRRRWPASFTGWRTWVRRPTSGCGSQGAWRVAPRAVGEFSTLAEASAEADRLHQRRRSRVLT